MSGSVPPVTPVLDSQKYYSRAEECRAKARSFRNPRARAQMFNIAADYERKARQAEQLETLKLAAE